MINIFTNLTDVWLATEFISQDYFLEYKQRLVLATDISIVVACIIVNPYYLLWPMAIYVIDRSIVYNELAE